MPADNLCGIGNANQSMQIAAMRAVVDTPPVQCECGSILFDEKVMVKMIPAVVAGTSRPTPNPIPVLVCAKCGKPIEFMREAIEKEEAKLTPSDAETSTPAKEQKKSTNLILD